MAAVVLCILGGRWALIKQFGTDVPEWDQWEAEGSHFLSPWLRGEPLWEGFLKPHNEHWIVPSKLLAFAVTYLNGHWDQRLQATVNAFLPATIGALMLGWCWTRLSRLGIASLALLIVVGLSGPLAWQNVLAGFHSAQFLLIIFALVALGTLPLAPAGTARWWCGAAAATIGVGTMATGFLASTIALAAVILRLLAERRTPKKEWATLTLCLLLTVCGLLLRREIPGHEALRAHSFGEAFRSFWANLCWLSPNGFWAILSWAPWTWLTLKLLRSPRQATPTAWVIVLVGSWAMLHICAAAIMRGAGGGGPASRYLDTQVLALLANAAALALLATPARRRLLGSLAVAGWTCCFVILAASRTRDVVTLEMTWIPNYRQESERNVRDYLASNERHFLERGAIPYPAVDGFLLHLQNARLLGLMPASVRKPIPGFEPAQAGPFRSSARAHAAEYRSATPPTAPGLPSEISRLGPEETWGSFGKSTSGEWRSRPLKPVSGGIRLEVAGTWKDPGVRLELQDAVTGSLLATLRPAHPTTKTWQPAFAPSPSVPFVLVARDVSTNGWLAFSAPRHEAPLSRFARLTCHDGRFALASGLILLVLFIPALAWPVGPGSSNERVS